MARVVDFFKVSRADEIKTPKFAIGFPIIVLVSTIGMFAGYVGRGNGWNFSINSDHWNHFGGFVGGILGPAIGISTLWLLAITIAQTRKIIGAQQTEIVAVKAAADADQRDRTFSRLLDTHQKLLAQIGVNDASKPEQPHPRRGIDGLLHLLNRASLSRGNIDALRDEFTWSAELRKREHSHQLFPYFHQMNLLCEWIGEIDDEVVKMTFTKQLAHRLSWVEIAFFALEEMGFQDSILEKTNDGIVKHNPPLKYVISMWTSPPNQRAASAIWHKYFHEHDTVAWRAWYVKIDQSA